jgi:hypothetical protein
VDKPSQKGLASLAEDQQRLTRTRIREAALEVVARRGFDATVDEIAKVYEACGLRPIEGLPRPTDDLDGWIEGLADTIHTRNANILGDAFWDIHAPRPNDSEAFSELEGVRRDYRVRGVRHLVDLAWQSAGGIDEPPEVLAFALNFSAFTTQALMIDFDRTPSQIGALTAELLKMLLRRAVDASRASHDLGTTDADTVQD